MKDPFQFSPEEVALVADTSFFRSKATISQKVREYLGQLHEVLKDELREQSLILPSQCNLDKFQFVKGEHLEDFPYQYLDFPRFYTRNEKFSFRSLFWWGHHMAFALILEGGALRQYKENLINRYSDVADRDLCLCLSSNLWEWKYGPGYTLELTHDRKPEVAAVLANRPFFKLSTFVSFEESTIMNGNLLGIGQKALRTVLPVITS